MNPVLYITFNRLEDFLGWCQVNQTAAFRDIHDSSEDDKFLFILIATALTYHGTVIPPTLLLAVYQEMIFVAPKPPPKTDGQPSAAFMKLCTKANEATAEALARWNEAAEKMSVVLSYGILSTTPPAILRALT